ncbi:STAS domain-containing protein [bacterium]|nr:STAS domain-containing protein [bacterium]
MRIDHCGPEEIRVTLDSNPTASDAHAWTEQIKEALTGDEKKAVVDLRSLTVVSSLGVNVIVGLYRHIESQGGNLRVLVANEKMGNVFQLFRLTDLFPVEVSPPSS